MRLIVLLVLATLVGVVPAPAGVAPARVHVLIVLVDGLDASWIGKELTPTLWGLAHDPQARTSFYPHGRAAMPSVTNTNHASLMTAAWPEAHGIVGNYVWDRVPGHPTLGSERARLLQVETLFTVAARARPPLVTAALFGKSRLVELCATVPGRQRAPDVLWGDALAETEPADGRVGYGSDARTMDAALATLATHDPDLMLVALPDVDRTSHAFGMDSTEARRAVLAADREIGRLADAVRRRGAWPDTVMMVTADHGFQSIRPDRVHGPRYPVVVLERELERAGISGLEPISNGGVESWFVPGAAPDRLDGDAATRLADARRIALAQPEVAEAWYRLPNPVDGGAAFTLATNRAEWRLDHPAAGELLVVARPGYTFADPFSPRTAGLLGQHGGPGQRDIPILITGAHVRAAVVDDAGDATPTNADLGATAAWLLGLPAPAMVGGGAVPGRLAGRVLREAFEDAR